MSRIIFVGGIHGVGKTSFSEELCNATTLISVTASTLIGAHKEKTKHVQNVDKNQDILIQAIKSTLKASENYLLDGHFYVLIPDGKIAKVETDVFRQIAPAGIFMLHAEVSVIQERLKKRDSKEYSLDFLDKFQKMEIAHGEQVAQELSIPFRSVDSSLELDLDKNMQFVQNLLQ